jgi:hypothetical protein
LCACPGFAPLWSISPDAPRAEDDIFAERLARELSRAIHAIVAPLKERIAALESALAQGGRK